MSFIRAGALVVHYDLCGPAGAEVVMLANSLGTNFHVWDPQAAALSRKYRVLRYDKRGHGLTECPPGEAYTIAQLAQDAAALLDALAIQRVHFCGLSIGGMIGQKLAATAPERIASLTLCDTANRIGPPQLWNDRIAAIRADGVAAIAAGTLSRWFTPRFHASHEAVVAGFAIMLSRTPAAGYIGCATAIRDEDLASDDARIRCPTLVVVGDQDQSTPVASAQALAAAIGGARLEIVADAAHISPIEQPHVLTALLTDFLARSGAQTNEDGEDAGDGTDARL
ncbi:MAG: pcaD [Rhodospirillales bacterium]|nr:pcaD [Rhodospirillales bacterium]